MNWVMKELRENLEKLRKIERKKHHPLIHHIHIRHGISKKTLLYVKEYGPHTNVPRTIIKESLKILFFASLISSAGGFMLENVKDVFVNIIPLIILLPVLNGLIGNYGTIISTRFANMLHSKVCSGLKDCTKLFDLFWQVIIISVITTLVSVSLSLVLSGVSGYGADYASSLKIALITVIDVLLVVSLLFITAIFAGLHYFKKNEDPDNFLIPITTSIADFGNMVILAVLVIVFF